VNTDGEHIFPAQPGTWLWSVHGLPGSAKFYACRNPVIAWMVQTTSQGTDCDWTSRRYLTEPVGTEDNMQCADLYSTFVEMPDGLCYMAGGGTHLSVAEALKEYKCEWPDYLPRPPDPPGTWEEVRTK